MKTPTKTNKLSLLELARKGISKQELDDVLKCNWEIYPILHEILGISRYYTKSWQGSYLSDHIRDGALCIAEDNSTNYQVIYQGCNPLEIRRAAQVRISFRASLYGNYALVQIPRHLNGEPLGAIKHDTD